MAGKRPPVLSSAERERRAAGTHRWWLPVDEDLNVHTEADQRDPLSAAKGIILGAAIGLAFWVVSVACVLWVTR
jgi:hypothetical protein